MIESGNHPFDTLTPDLLIDAVESQGFLSDGGFLALNSYENRVYQIGIENKTPMIAKFYRPNRWTDEQIFEEHQFCFQLHIIHHLQLTYPKFYLLKKPFHLCQKKP